MTKQQAAYCLAVSTKQIERWTREKRLQAKKWKRPEGGPAIAVYHPDDVERIAHDRNPDAEPFLLPAAEKPTNGTHAIAVRQPSAEQFLQALSAAISGMSQTSQTGPARLWLTLREAADYSGLPAATLLEFLLSGRLPALDVGRRRRGGRWRIRQVDLRKLNAIPLETHYKVLAQSQQV